MKNTESLNRLSIALDDFLVLLKRAEKAELELKKITENKDKSFIYCSEKEFFNRKNIEKVLVSNDIIFDELKNEIKKLQKQNCDYKMRFSSLENNWLFRFLSKYNFL